MTRRTFFSAIKRATASAVVLPEVVSLSLVLLCAFCPAAGVAQGLDPQLQEIRTLIREKRYPLALESLRLVARQIQDLRLESVAPAFPAAPVGWSALPALSLLEEDEIWSSRIVAQRAYVAVPGPARMDFTIDVHSPFAPAVALSFNPLAILGDPRSRTIDVGGERGLLHFNPDTGDAVLRILVGKDLLVTARGRGLASPDTVVNTARGLDLPLLRLKTGM